MFSIDDIKNEANSVMDILKNIKTVEDARNLRHYGYSEDEVSVSVDGDIQPLKDYMFENRGIDFAKVEVDGVRVSGGINIDGCFYDRNEDQLFFDIYTSPDDEYPAYEDVTLDSIDFLDMSEDKER